MNTKLRLHQSQLNQIIDGIISGSKNFKDIKRIVMSCCPGSGKGSVCVHAGKLIKAGFADNICVIVPRQSLQLQAEQVCMDTFFQKLFGVKISLRASTNDRDPCRGTEGFISTYQALGHDKQKNVLRTIKNRRYILICDEHHHVEKDSPWAEAVEELEKAAKYTILMSGTLSRHNKKQIAFMKYKNGYVDLVDTNETKIIRYSRSDALNEQAILPISFHLFDGSFEWETHDGKFVSVPSFDEVEKKFNSSAVFTALETEFAKQLIESCISHWLEEKKRNKNSKILFICARYEDAKRTTRYVESLGVPCLIATSHDNELCIENIQKYKANSPGLSTIAIGYEGMDVPPITHICILTRIRSKEWLEQACSRGTRVDKGAGPYCEQMCNVFAPKDNLFLEFVEYIEKEQLTRASTTHSIEEQLPLFQLNECGEGGLEQGPCKPLRSQILEMSKKVLGNKFVYEPPPPQTPKQEELTIRRDIDRYLKRYAYEQGFEYPAVMREAKAIDETPRGEMTIKQLKYFFYRVKSMFPMDYSRPVSKQFNLIEEKFF